MTAERVGSERIALRAVLAAVSGLLVGYFSYFPMVNTDIWWHLAAGREILARRAFLYTDPFAYTLDHPQWINVHWGFQLPAYLLMRLFGPWGLVALKAVIVIGASSLLCLMKRSVTYAAACGMAMCLLMYEGRYLILVRPILFTLVGLAVFLFVLERYRESGNVRLLFVLLPMQLLWANTQGLFVLGPLMVLCYAAGAWVDTGCGRGQSAPRVGSAAATLIACAAAVSLVSCLNPYGARVWLLAFRLAGRINPRGSNIFSRNISENIPLLELEGSDVRYLYVVGTAALAVVVLACVGRKRPDGAHVFLLVVFAALALAAKRNVLQYLFIVAPLLGIYGERALFGGLAKNRDRPARVGRWVAIGLSLVVGARIADHGQIVAGYPRRSALAPFRYPVEAVDYLEQNPVEGRVFNADRYGGYLMWRLYPKKLVFVDGRMIIRDGAFFEEYLAILRHPDHYFEGVAERFGITHAVLPTAIHPAYDRLVEWLYDSPRWSLVFADGASAVYVRADLAKSPVIEMTDDRCVDAVRAHLTERWAGQEAIRDEALTMVDDFRRRLVAAKR